MAVVFDAVTAFSRGEGVKLLVTAAEGELVVVFPVAADFDLRYVVDITAALGLKSGVLVDFGVELVLAAYFCTGKVVICAAAYSGLRFVGVLVEHAIAANVKVNRNQGVGFGTATNLCKRREE